MEVIAQGSTESLLIEVVDRLEQLTQLPIGTTFDVLDDSGTYKITGQDVVLNGTMVGECVVDTTIPALWSKDRYFLFLNFVTVPDSPRLGPFEFFVN